MERFGQQVMARKGLLLGLFVVLTLLAAVFAAQTRLTADIGRWQPSWGEFAATHIRFAPVLPGSNRLLVALEPRAQDIWTEDFFAAYKKLTDEVAALPGIAPRSVLSLWRPGVRYIRSRDDRLGSLSVIPGDLSDSTMSPERLEQTRLNVLAPGFARRFIAADFSAALIEADFQRDVTTAWSPDEARRFVQMFDDLRATYNEAGFHLHVMTPGEEMGRLSSGLAMAALFAALSLALVCLFLWLAFGSALTALAVMGASLAAVLWQLGAMRFLGLQLDPATMWMLAPLAAISLTWGMLQASRFAAALEAGASPLRAARTAFIAGLAPGTLSGLVMLLGIGLLSLSSILAIRDMAMGAVFALAAFWIANLFLLPLLLASLPETPSLSTHLSKRQALRNKLAGFLGRISKPHTARWGAILSMVGVVLVLSHFFMSGASLPNGLLAPAPGLQSDADYLAKTFPASTNLYTVAVEAPAGACTEYEMLHYLDGLTWHLANVQGVQHAASIADAIKTTSAMWNEGNPKWRDLPRNKFALVQSVQPIPVSSRLLNPDCSIMPIRLNLADGRADTLLRVSQAASAYREKNPPPEGMSVHLAMGEQGERAGTKIELYQMQGRIMSLFTLVLLSILALAYRDWRALLACGIPLLLVALLQRAASFFVQSEILIANFAVPVFIMALAALFVTQTYARMRQSLKQGLNATDAYRITATETGWLLFLISCVLSLAFAAWWFSSAALQAELGIQFALGVILAALASLFVVPALSVWLEMIVPRRTPL